MVMFRHTTPFRRGGKWRRGDIRFYQRKAPKLRYAVTRRSGEGEKTETKPFASDPEKKADFAARRGVQEKGPLRKIRERKKYLYRKDSLEGRKKKGSPRLFLWKEKEIVDRTISRLGVF